MIFTVGKTDVYDEYTSLTAGANVWETKWQAQRYQPAGFSVYGVEAVWRKDTEITRNNWDNLMFTRPLVKL